MDQVLHGGGMCSTECPRFSMFQAFTNLSNVVRMIKDSFVNEVNECLNDSTGFIGTPRL